MSLFKKIEDLQQGRGRSLTAQQFFKENDAKGYFTKPDFVDYANSMTANEAIEFINLVNQLRAGSRLNLKFQLRTDKSGRDYAWIDFQFVKGTKGFKLIVGSDILRFIEEYAVGLIKVDFTAEELSEVALNA